MTVAAFLVALALIAVALSAVMMVAWLIQQRTGNSGWVDTVWTFGLGLTGIAVALVPVGQAAASWRGPAVAAFMAAWALRLGLHIARRTAGISDDPRYAQLIKGWGSSARSEMFWLLQKQALVSIPLAAAALIAAHNPDPDLRGLDVIALAIMLAALIGEAVADEQLRAFRAAPDTAGRICDVGLWRYSRHPNYFFQWLGWVSFPLLAVDLSGGYPLGWLALAAPVCMYWLLVHISGIPPLEEHMLRSRGRAYESYQRRTSPFFPLPPVTEGRST
jgi:steroid 5-alpha reductase family enzyme